MKTLSFIFQWALRILIAYYLLKYSYVKLSGQPSAIELFTTLNMEPWGRITIGILELITVILILYPRATVFGGLLGMISMTAVIFYHLKELGIAINGDSFLFFIACVIFVASLLLVILNRKQLTTCIFTS
ncbi:DoxX family protein [Flavobacterium sp. ANB]|uniref:DoxX family protein n=1 Tax=unclassified Flavobacterium TaxID=196869 RepID=UPI0012B95834|nr:MULTISPECIES: DoxX family protein [unclassified Flavobacterium]MBF4519018.1 DoxX family protein [Flavobacterium sp. ANB]MTD71620.1 DoxX family protein [Flavobacterium sp. LC2016-13]